jgi:hypothetical protein
MVGGVIITRRACLSNVLTTHGRRRLQGFLPQLDEFYFTTAEKKILEN